MEKLKSKLNDIIDKINNTPLSNQEELDFFHDMMQNDGNITVRNINKYNTSDLITLIIRMDNEDIPFEEIKNDIVPIKSEINLLSLTNFFNIFDFLFQLSNNEDISSKGIDNIYQKYIKYLEESGFFIEKCIIEKNFFLGDKIKFGKLVHLISKYKSESMGLRIIGFESCTYLIEKGLIEEILSLITTGKFTQIGNPKSIKKINKKRETFEELKRLAEQEDLMDLIEDIERIDMFIDKISTRIMKLEKIKKSQIKEKNKKIGLYSNLISVLPSLTRITNEDISFIDDEELKKEIIFKILERNKERYFNLVDEYKTNKKFELNEFDKTLLRYNIKISDEYHKSIVANNIDENTLKAKLNILQENCFDFIRKDETVLVKVLLFSSTFAIEKMKVWINKEIITKEFLINNINALMSAPKDLNEQLAEIYEKSKIVPQFDIINNNIELFKKNNICLQNIKKYDINLFFENNDKLAFALDLLNKYNINLNSNNLIDFSILINPKKICIIDAFIEVGMFEYLKEHIEIINKDIKFIKKIILLNELGYNIFDQNNSLLSIISNDNKFYVPDKELDLYIANDTFDYMNLECYVVLEEEKNVVIGEDINNDFLISILDTNFKLDNNIYCFDGIAISRNKVLRNMTTLSNYEFEDEIDDSEMLITSILFGSILDENSILKIINSINSKIETCKIQIKA